MNFVVILGSVRPNRKGLRAARYVVRELEARGHAVSLVDPQPLDLPMLTRMYKEYPAGEVPPALERLATLYRAADGFVIVTAEYNHGLPPALVNLLDHFLEEYFFRPSAIVSYSAGQFGGVRAAMHLRAVLAELGMPSIPSTLPLPKVKTLLGDDGAPQDFAMAGRFEKFASEFEWYARALAAERARGVPY
jgi:NAD(P)H-dependent FMN reductase